MLVVLGRFMGWQELPGDQSVRCELVTVSSFSTMGDWSHWWILKGRLRKAAWNQP
jgi:hypothetical protein